MSHPCCTLQSRSSVSASTTTPAAWRLHSKLSRPVLGAHRQSLLPALRASPTSAHGFVPEDRLHINDQGHNTLLPKQRALALNFSDINTTFPQQATSLSAQSPSARFPSSSLASSRKVLRVAVDVDEVLGRFLFALNIFCKEQYGMEYNVHDYWVYEFAKIWNCSTDKSNHIVHEFFKSQHFNDGIPVIPGALETLQRLQTYCELVVVTSRQHVIQDATMEWINNHYPGIFQDVYFGNHFALNGTSRKKSEICKSIGAQVLIDDNPSYAQECAAAGLNVLLYDWEGGYPWSKMTTEQDASNISVVRSWEEVEQQVAVLHQQIASQ